MLADLQSRSNASTIVPRGGAPTQREVPALRSILANRRWAIRSAPFPHVVASDVFVDAFYRQLEHAFQATLDLGFSPTPDGTRLSRSRRGYDAYLSGFDPDLSGPLSIFVSRPWHDFLARMMRLDATLDINGGLHHHAVGSANGSIHNDLVPGWFVDRPRPDGVNPTRPGTCSYFDGTSADPNLVKRESVRGVAALFYLNNPPWAPGDGGETGLYRSSHDRIDQPAATVAPINNSLLVFECTPYSYHSFLTNHRHPRNSVILWLHRKKAEAVARWGEHAITKWAKRG